MIKLLHEKQKNVPRLWTKYLLSEQVLPSGFKSIPSLQVHARPAEVGRQTVLQSPRPPFPAHPPPTEISNISILCSGFLLMKYTLYVSKCCWYVYFLWQITFNGLSAYLSIKAQYE
jgi:hypothetical protein